MDTNPHILKPRFVAGRHRPADNDKNGDVITDPTKSGTGNDTT